MNPTAFTLCLETVSDGISTSAGLEQLFQQIREIKTGIQAVQFWAKEQKNTAFHKEFKLSYVKFKNNLIEAITLSKNLLSLTALEEPAAEDRGFVQSWKTKGRTEKPGSEAPVQPIPLYLPNAKWSELSENTRRYSDHDARTGKHQQR